jgi:agmatine/peptidylarginine deiminase
MMIAYLKRMLCTIVLCLFIFEAAVSASVIPDRRVVAEWEPAIGVMIRWPLGIPESLVVALAEEPTLFVLVDDDTSEDDARTLFQDLGINPGHVEFVFTDTYSHWTRDYGPQFLISETSWEVVDYEYQGYPQEWGCTLCNPGMERYDCNGQRFCNDEPNHSAYDCIVNDGTCEDVNGNGQIDDFLGDGWCDNGRYGFNFRCDEFGWDCGDCGDPIVDPNGYCDQYFDGNTGMRPAFLSMSGRPAPETPGRSFADDSASNYDFAMHIGWDILSLPLYFTGGNFMTDGYDMGFATYLMLNENTMWIEEFNGIVDHYLGLKNFYMINNPDIYGIQHIDCSAKLLNTETVVVKQVHESHPEYECMEELAEFFKGLTTFYGRPFTVRRMFCPSISGGTPTAAYVNSLILNNRVYVPLYGIAGDAQAIATYQDIMPGYEVLGFQYSAWYSHDALHCRTMGIFDPQMLHISHAALRDEDVGALVTLPVQALITDYSQTGIVSETVMLQWRYDGETDWQNVPLAHDSETGMFHGEIPPLDELATVHYFISAQNNANRTVSHPTAGWHVFETGESSVPTPTPAPDCLHHGDVDFNGTITAADAQLAFQIALGMYQPTFAEFCAADCNGDGLVTAGDAQQIFYTVFGGECVDPLP